MLSRIFRKIDRDYLNGYIRKSIDFKKSQLVLSKLNKDLEYKIVIHHRKNKNDLISQLCDLYGSDKGEISSGPHPYPWPSHTYADYYSRLFDHCRHQVKYVFECGLGTNNPDIVSSMGIKGRPGASLRVWRDYFPNAQIVGADIDRDILFEETRIKTFYMNQLNSDSIQKMFESAGVEKFDFMLDDGLHTFEGGRSLLENSIHKLASNGVYIIEDVAVGDLESYKDYFMDKNYIVDYVSLFRPSIPLADNNLIIVRLK